MMATSTAIAPITTESTTFIDGSLISIISWALDVLQTNVSVMTQPVRCRLTSTSYGKRMR
jgi:hypothetical protein